LVLGFSGGVALTDVLGPVATVHTFPRVDDAVALANQTPLGLAGYVFGKEDHAWAIAKQMRTGVIKINDVTMLNLHPLSPRPAWGLSGLGDEGVRDTFEFFRGSRIIGVAARPEGAVEASE
jgi:phenylacetaldehyde dehydrogenase